MLRSILAVLGGFATMAVLVMVTTAIAAGETAPATPTYRLPLRRGVDLRARRLAAAWHGAAVHAPVPVGRGDRFHLSAGRAGEPATRCHSLHAVVLGGEVRVRTPGVIRRRLAGPGGGARRCVGRPS